MVAAKKINTSFASMGAGGTKKDNSSVVTIGIILTTSDFSFASVTDMAVKANWEAGIKAKKVFPFFGLDSYEDQSSEATIYESALKRRKTTDQGVKRYMFNFDQPLDQHRAMQTFRDGDLRVFRVERDGKICFFNDNGVCNGFSTSLVSPIKMKDVPADGSSPALSALYLDLADYTEWDLNGDEFNPGSSWTASSLECPVPVYINQVSASASSIVVHIGSKDGYETTGAVKYVDITGITPADIVVYDTDGTSVITVGTITENATLDGKYTIPKAATDFTDGMYVGLKSMGTQATTGLLIDMVEKLTLNVT